MKQSRLLVVLITCSTIVLTAICTGNMFVLVRAIEALSASIEHEASDMLVGNANLCEAEDSSSGYTVESAPAEDPGDWYSSDEYEEDSGEDTDVWTEEHDSGGEDRDGGPDEWYDSDSDRGPEDELANEGEQSGKYPEIAEDEGQGALSNGSGGDWSNDAYSVASSEQASEKAEAGLSDSDISSFTEESVTGTDAAADKETADKKSEQEDMDVPSGVDTSADGPSADELATYGGSACSMEESEAQEMSKADQLDNSTLDYHTEPIVSENEAVSADSAADSGDSTNLGPKSVAESVEASAGLAESTVPEPTASTEDIGGEKIAELLSDSVSYESGGYTQDGDGFSLLADAGEEQVVIFNAEGLNSFKHLSFTICGSTPSGEIDVIVCGGELPPNRQTFNSCQEPRDVQIELTDISVVEIHFKNTSNQESRLIFSQLTVSDDA